MGRRNVVRVNIRDGKAVQKESGLAEHAEKRQKLTHDFFPTKPSGPRTGVQDRTESSAAGGSKAAPSPMGSAGGATPQEFAPSYALAEGRVITVDDSVKTEPRLASAMLQGLALPKDMQSVPEGLQPSLVQAGAYLVQAGQALLRSSKDAELVLAKRARFHDELKVEREKVRSYKGSLKMAKTQIAELERERDEMEAKVKAAEREVAKVLRREKRTMKEVDGKAYQAGFDRAGAEYMREARAMVNDAIRMRVPIAYRTGYKDRVKAVCGVVQSGADADLMKSIPAPETPELVLPYIEEECAPLPLEEFPESEDEVEDLTLADADDDAGGGKDAEKTAEVADPNSTQAEGDPMNVDKDAEAEANASAPQVDATLAEAGANVDGAA